MSAQEQILKYIDQNAKVNIGPLKYYILKHFDSDSAAKYLSIVYAGRNKYQIFLIIRDTLLKYGHYDLVDFEDNENDYFRTPANKREEYIEGIISSLFEGDTLWVEEMRGIVAYESI